MVRKPRLFIGSSAEAIHYVEAVFEGLKREAEVTMWMNAFEELEYTMNDLEKQLNTNDFAVFIFTPDDVIEIRKEKYLATRDNTLFEMGLFWGRLKRGRVFYIIPNDTKGIVHKNSIEPLDYHLLSDLTGLNPLKYDIRDDGDIVQEVAGACIKIKRKIREKGLLPNLQNKIDDLIVQKKESEVVAKFSTLLTLELLKSDRSKVASFLSENLKRAHSVPEGYEIIDVGVWKLEGTDGLKHVAGKKSSIDFYHFNVNKGIDDNRIFVIDSYLNSEIIFIKKSEFYNAYLICYPIENSMVLTVTFSSEEYDAIDLTEDEKDFLLGRNKRLMKTINELFGGATL
ncbi:TIR domain-containing protein [Bacillus sp. AFS017336]|uniref:TIR domain-containing protein n=1 Tax=Bacillus sp. AFS017336 TaxID=2033489 RepID=UPI000BF23C51|nr:TIR domain-containing protein [Bacillus sp. AFS017336]PEK99077.1 nucleotide-binding-like protein [Bacillus sp. AFS017336]